MKTYETVTEALEDLRQQGFTLDYNLKNDCLKCQQSSIELHPDDFDIVDTYRFEGMTDPGDSTVIYVIEAHNGDRGTLIDAYGPYADAITPEMAEKLTMRPDK
ncbi:phosphoribosylpyrophosphate synthetase [Spirosoma montaniterrae]|uniref:Phosphoribosylpyrophosphate synthetase n=1 Tax=Spirosoma montaniterrae TaxID=1178516 RepID=A0A1P9X2F5_9BACT|nr:phosphoribosylpyrophosphate synthetase [Spirosoma montaniterrae]AQG81799.1 phosphoribosylpyrophosphate synthetase [Spirosoma montaniterrae]